MSENEKLREALGKIATARSAMDGGSINECRRIARAALSTPCVEQDADEVECERHSEEWYSSAQMDEITADEANDWLEWSRLEGPYPGVDTIKGMHAKVRAALQMGGEKP